MTAVLTVKTQRTRISSHLKNRCPTRPIRYKLVCEKNVFCYLDFCLYLKANYPKSLPFALKSTFAFEIHCKTSLRPGPASGERDKKLAHPQKNGERSEPNVSLRRGKGFAAALAPLPDHHSTSVRSIFPISPRFLPVSPSAEPGPRLSQKALTDS